MALTPPWSSQAVLHGHFTPREPLKLPFYLLPHPQSSLPSLPPGASKLSAAKVLKVARVVQYVEGRLTAGECAGPLLLLCNDKVLSPEMTLCAAQVHLWKNGAEEMVITYTDAAAPDQHS